MSLTLVQATRLFCNPSDGCSRILLQLVDNGWLRLTPESELLSQRIVGRRA